MKKLYIALLSPISFMASADSYLHDMSKCALQSADDDRLLCYDEISIKLGVSVPLSGKSKNTGKWMLQSSNSQIDDSTNVYLSVLSDEEITSGNDLVRPELFIRCAENKTRVFIKWHLYLGLESTTMLTRLDSDKAETTTWSISTDNKAVFSKDNNVTYTKLLIGRNRLLAQITPYSRNPVIATFSIGGLKNAIAPLSKACHW